MKELDTPRHSNGASDGSPEHSSSENSMLDFVKSEYFQENLKRLQSMVARGKLASLKKSSHAKRGRHIPIHHVVKRVDPFGRSWPSGPWDTEPDLVMWRSPATAWYPAGFACRIIRGPYGQLCGYVALPWFHPAYEKFVDENPVADLEAHGGLTFASHASGARRDVYRYIPVTKERTDVWWLGFDCAHAWDITPGMDLSVSGERMSELFPGTSVYRDLPVVFEMVAHLADQLAAMRPAYFRAHSTQHKRKPYYAR